MNKKYLTLVSRIREELSEIKQAVDRAQRHHGILGRTSLGAQVASEHSPILPVRKSP